MLRTQTEAERKYQGDFFGWFLALNGLLFAALGFPWKDAPDLVYVLAALGLLRATSWWVGSEITARQIGMLRSMALDRKVPESEVGPDDGLVGQGLGGRDDA